MNTKTISVDAMGGDFGPRVIVPACVDFVKNNPGFSLLLFGIESNIQVELAKLQGVDAARLKVCHAPEVVTGEDSPSLAMRNKKQSSMRLAIDAVKQGAASATVSAGNTGALMATAKFVLKMIPGLDRPAIVAPFPALTSKNQLGSTYVLDLGANVESTEENLIQLLTHVVGIHSPRVGLLNVGSESIKGKDLLKQVHASLAGIKQLNFVGFVEGNDFFNDKCDVVVTNGFEGNIALKTGEGAVLLFSSVLKQCFHRNALSKLVGIFARLVMKPLKTTLDPRNYNGATFIGLNGVVVKSHGNADQASFYNALERAAAQVETFVPEVLQSELHVLGARRVAT